MTYLEAKGAAGKFDKKHPAHPAPCKFGKDFEQTFDAFNKQSGATKSRKSCKMVKNPGYATACWPYMYSRI